MTIRIPVTCHSEDESIAAQTEREEALWGQVVLLTHRIEGLREDIKLRDELISLLRQQAGVTAPTVPSTLTHPMLAEKAPAGPESYCQCGRRKSYRSGACLSCAAKVRARTKSQLYRRVKRTEYSSCQDCGKAKTANAAKRCRSCSAKEWTQRARQPIEETKS